MNVVYLSPAFPPTARHFCKALKTRGVRVLGVGDESLPDSLRACLDDYVLEPCMHQFESLERAVAMLAERHGPIDRIDSNGEHWLTAEARLRERFGVAGLRLVELEQQLSKSSMAKLFAAAGIAHPPAAVVASPNAVRNLLQAHGFPLVFKPDVGSGARDTFRVNNQLELDSTLQRNLSQHIAQPFITGDIVTYDGLTDRQGRIVFAISHRYDTGIMQIREACRDGYYYSLREIPEELAEIGSSAVQAFGIRERFFHLELFEAASGYVALEMNLRPPGGFTTDMMNLAANTDIYALWASVMRGDSLPADIGPRARHVAHAGRRHDRSYRLSHAELTAALGTTLAAVEPIPAAFADTMGDVAYLLRHADQAELLEAIALVQAR